MRNFRIRLSLSAQVSLALATFAKSSVPDLTGKEVYHKIATRQMRLITKRNRHEI